MGDRTYATVTIKRDYVPLIKAYIKNNESDDIFEWYEEKGQNLPGDPLFVFVDYEANYGEMRDVTDILCELHIPYDHYWDNGGDYTAGSIYARVDPEGEYHTTEVEEATEGMIDIGGVMAKLTEEGATIEGVRSWLAAYEADNFGIYENQADLAAIPMRELTEEESRLVMEFKLTEE